MINGDIMTAQKLEQCLCCGSENLKLVLDLNEQPMANSFKQAADDSELMFPLKLNLCTTCTHLQLSHAVDPDLLFKNYLYVSGTSQTMRDYFDWFADFTTRYFSSPPKTVLDIACNDGSQLNSYKSIGMRTFGIDPAENLYKISSVNHMVICDYFSDKYIDSLQQHRLDIITAQNVFAHNSYPLEFLKTCREIMHDNSVLFVQTSQADMVKNNEFDTIYHEHLSFFNANSMKALVDRAGLHLLDIVKTPIHGNSYVFVIGKVSGNTELVDQVLRQERELGLQNLITYDIYAERCRQVIKDLVNTLGEFKARGYLLVGYGAAAKGMTLLNFGAIDLDFVIDDNPLKQGLYTPGTGAAVVNIDSLDTHSDAKIAFVPLAWNFFSEIKSKILQKRTNQDDVFIKYFPTITVEQAQN